MKAEFRGELALMVIFGAGASYDSCPHLLPRSSLDREQHRPPLGNQLFEDRKAFNEWGTYRYPQMRSAIPKLRSASDVEEEMHRIQDQADNDYGMREVHAIKYYLRRVLWSCGEDWWVENSGVTNYGQLIREIHQWRLRHTNDEIRFVTFNYDLLLERACKQVVDLDSVTDYTTPAYRIYNPHGSVKWVHPIKSTSISLNAADQNLTGETAERVIINTGDRLVLGPEFLETNHPDEFRKPEQVFTYPALALPVNSKNDFECPPKDIEEMTVDIRRVRNLLVIGWAGREQKFLDLWKAQRYGSVPTEIDRTWIVDKGDGGKNLERILRQHLRCQNYVQMTDGFSAFVTQSDGRGNGLLDLIASLG